MYATCLFCHGALGTNEVIEHFPVGKRLAYDPAKGRLWVVCTKCQRWNLSPLETRWEAIDEAERAYRDTKKRVATDNVGLARLQDGTDLIRIGTPELPEFAAWRYGDTFGRRRNKAMVSIAAFSMAGAFASRFTERTLGLAFGGALLLQVGAAVSYGILGALRVRVQIRDQEGNRRLLSQGEAWSARYAVDPGSGSLQLTIASRHGTPFDSTPRQAYERVKSVTRFAFDEKFAIHLSGSAAQSALGSLMPVTNHSGGDAVQIENAAKLVEESQTPARLLWKLPGMDRKGFWKSAGMPGSLINLQPEFRLALEMSLHEADERRAMEGELRELEQRWKEAEEIAAIADSLTLPEGTAGQLARLHHKATSAVSDSAQRDN